MGQWQIISAKGVPVGELFDDGGWQRPGDDGFSQDAVRAKCQKGESFNYVGASPLATSPQAQADQAAADQRKADADKAAVLSAIDPTAHLTFASRRAIEDQYQELKAAIERLGSAAPEDALGRLDAWRDEELAKLDQDLPAAAEAAPEPAT